jgi:hypothetical protein
MLSHELKALKYGHCRGRTSSFGKPATAGRRQAEKRGLEKKPSHRRARHTRARGERLQPPGSSQRLPSCRRGDNPGRRSSLSYTRPSTRPRWRQVIASLPLATTAGRKGGSWSYTILKRNRGGSRQGSKIEILNQTGPELTERRRQADQQE